MTGYIYMVTCSETNKVYIGQVTHEYHRRFNRHIRTAFKTKKRIKDCKFYRAIRKYGKDSFSVECLEKKLLILSKVGLELEGKQFTNI